MTCLNVHVQCYMVLLRSIKSSLLSMFLCVLSFLLHNLLYFIIINTTKCYKFKNDKYMKSFSVFVKNVLKTITFIDSQNIIVLNFKHSFFFCV